MNSLATRLAGGAVVAAFLLASAAPALAAVWSGAPKRPPSATSFVADSVFWQCSRTLCSTGPDTALGDQISACTALVRKVGPLSAFSIGGQAYDAKRLAACNAAA